MCNLSLSLSLSLVDMHFDIDLILILGFDSLQTRKYSRESRDFFYISACDLDLEQINLIYFAYHFGS